MIKNIVFDLGGIYFVTDKWQCILSKKFGISQKKSREIIQEYYNCALSETKSKMFWINLKKEIKFNDSWTALRSMFINSIKPNKKFICFIKNLHKNGYKLFYLSNSHIDVHPYLDRKYIFSTKFDDGILSHKVPFYKPDKRIYVYFVRKMKIKPEETIFVDDNKINLLPAKAMGMKTLHFKNISSFKKNMKKFGVI